MTLSFVTNLVHHHQLPLADEFYRLLGDKYHYIATNELPEWLINGGYDPTLDRPFIIRTYRSREEYNEARKLIDDSDVVIVGAAPDDWVLNRKKNDKVTFHYSERWIRSASLRVFSPRSLFNIYKNYYVFRGGRVYMLCASAFTAQDVHFYGCFPGRCFKWGYFTAVENPINMPIRAKASIMWCARFIKLKHPELAVKLASRLKKKGYSFTLDMFGSGEELEKTRSLANQSGVGDVVSFCGNRPNAVILDEMRRHEVFLFTSDRHEGWGAVLNEAMSCGCVPVVSDGIGSAPYLVNDGENGLLFSSCNLDSLEKAVQSLLDNPKRIETMSKSAAETMLNEWSPRVAAENFIDLADHAFNNTLHYYKRTEGPASWDK